MDNNINGATMVQIAPAGKLDFIEIQNHRSLEGIDSEQKRKIFSFALAVILSRHLPVPTAPVESPSSYFISNIESQVRDLSNAFNERISIDYEIVRDFTQKLWGIRYFTLHNVRNIGSFYPFNFFEIISGIGVSVDEKTYAYVNEHKVAIIDISNAISNVLIAKQESEINS